MTFSAFAIACTSAPVSGSAAAGSADDTQVLARWLAASAALALGGWASLPILFGRGKRAVRSFEWAADGTWRLQLVDGSSETATLLPATATLGPGAGWAILLTWRADGPGAAWRRRRYALIEVSGVGSADFRSLRGRLKLEAGVRRTVSP